MVEIEKTDIKEDSGHKTQDIYRKVSWQAGEGCAFVTIH